MGCFKTLLKCVMFAFNSTLFLAGAAPLFLGIWLWLTPTLNLAILDQFDQIEDAPAVLKQLLNNMSYLMMAVGVVLLVIAFLGCCAMIKLSKFILLLFFGTVMVALIVMLTGAGLIVGFKPLTEELMDQVGTKAVESIKMYYGTSSEVTRLWGTTMDQLGCCGVYNYTDFIGSPYYSSNVETFPPQCCPSGSDAVQVMCDSDMAYNASSTIAGCLTRITKVFEDNKRLSAIVLLVIAGLEVCAMVVSMALYCKIK